MANNSNHSTRQLYKKIWIPLRQWCSKMLGMFRDKNDDDDHFNHPFAVF